MKKTNGSVFVELYVECPYCEEYINVENDISKEEYRKLCYDDCGSINWGSGNKINESITCPECEKQFIIEEFVY